MIAIAIFTTGFSSNATLLCLRVITPNVFEAVTLPSGEEEVWFPCVNGLNGDGRWDSGNSAASFSRNNATVFLMNILWFLQVKNKILLFNYKRPKYTVTRNITDR